MITPPTRSSVLEMSIDSVTVTGEAMARTSEPSRCVRSPVRIPSKKAMSCLMSCRKSVSRTETMILREMRLKQSDERPPSAPSATEQPRYRRITCRKEAFAAPHLPSCAPGVPGMHACEPAMTWSKICPWKLGRKRRSAEVVTTQRRATPKSGSCGRASLRPRRKYCEVVRAPPDLTPLSPRSTPSPVERSFLLKQAGQASQSQSGQR
mmetsp:Transcript_44337/g.147013  ORF Transcript_44337/g.147013 Transcript_44337/m.147013 type:complete len:208 (-) Transcript_44337:802-1425(-)